MTTPGLSTYVTLEMVAQRPAPQERRAGVESGPAPQPWQTPTSQTELGSAVAELEKADQYLDARRELKAQLDDPKRSNASKVFLDIAHYDQEPKLVDVYV